MSQEDSLYSYLKQKEMSIFVYKPEKEGQSRSCLEKLADVGGRRCGERM
jgi:hypothetical protein